MPYLLVLVVAAFVSLAVPVEAQTFGPAIVQPDASLVINGRRFVLADIEIVPTDRTCDVSISPPACGPRAFLALRRKVQQFVSCKLRVDLPNPDAAECRHNAAHPAGGEDLGAFLIAQGWATATPSAPPLYQTLETIARSHGRGVWGVLIEDLINPQLQ